MRVLVSWLMAGLILTGCEREAVHERKSPLPAQAFVWQRGWKPEVSAAVRSAAPLAALHILAAEVHFKADKPEITNVEPDWRALQDFRGQIGAVLRIHASAAKTHWNEAALQAVHDLAVSTLARYAAGGIALAELQLDYDCPESRLTDYTRMVHDLKAAMPATTVRITALPAWLNQSAVGALLAESPGYVLQVHSLHLPQHGGPVTLIDLDETRQAVSRAVKFGVPFRVALPTYSCVLEFDEKGAVKEVYGEDLPAGMSLSERRYAVLDSDAFALAELMAAWRQHAPELMQAVIWYRLPVASDRLNWPAATLQKIVRGATLRRGWSGMIKVRTEGQSEIVLRQNGDAPDDLPTQIVVEWQGDKAEAADGLRGYTTLEQDPGRIRFQLGQRSRYGRVWPGQEIVIGWARLPASGGKATVKLPP